jgi:hypothetical protein
MLAWARVEMMTSPAATEERILGKENVDDFVCLWLIRVEPNWTRVPQIHETVSFVCYSFNQLEVWIQPSRTGR